MHQVSYIIPVCNFGNKQEFLKRKESLGEVLVFLASQVDVEIDVVLVEQVVNPEYERFTYDLPKESARVSNLFSIRKIIVEYPVFNKAWLCNKGADAALYPDILIGDVDCLCKGNTYICDLIDFVRAKNINWCFGWRFVYYLNNESSQLYIKEKKVRLGLSVRNGRVKRGGAEGGIVYFKRHFLLGRLYGYNEMFENLGGTDNEIISRAENASSTYMSFPKVLLHLWHPVSPMKEGHERSKNFMLYRFTKMNPDVVGRFVSKHRAGKDAPVSDTCQISDMFAAESQDCRECSKSFCSVLLILESAHKEEIRRIVSTYKRELNGVLEKINSLTGFIVGKGKELA